MHGHGFEAITPIMAVPRDHSPTERTMSETATKPDHADFERRLEEQRTLLTGYCYRMLGSPYEAEDAVQETMLRAWKAYDGFDGRSSLSTWLYRIATNVCLDALQGRKRRAIPMDLSPSGTADTPLPAPVSWDTWVQPIPDTAVLPESGDPAEVVEARETIRLAFVAALQNLPPKQRAVLILREVLRWQASEVAELLDTSVASVNSALQRARATLDSTVVGDRRTLDPTDDEAQQDLLARYLDAFERYDMDAFVKLLHEDATHNMPPYEMWLRGPDQMTAWMMGPGITCRGSRLLPVHGNGAPGFAIYRPTGPGGLREPFNVHLIDVVDGRVAGITYFLDVDLFPLFGLPPHLPA
jgi:RNA polymerase sigma-70 factor (ECF subfamily)